MDERDKTVLTLGSNRGLTKLEFFLSRASLEVRRADSRHQARSILNGTTADAVILCWPLAGCRIVGLVSELRTAGVGLAEPAIVVLAEPDTVADLREIGLSGAIVLSTDERALELERTVAALLAEGARRAVRVLVKLDVDLDDGKLHRACQTVNLSRSGMALRTRERFDPGCVSSFSFFLPDGERPIEGEAEVVRRVDPEAEGFEGLGLRFRNLLHDGAERLDEFLAARAMTPAGPPGWTDLSAAHR